MRIREWLNVVMVFKLYYTLGQTLTHQENISEVQCMRFHVECDPVYRGKQDTTYKKEKRFSRHEE